VDALADCRAATQQAEDPGPQPPPLRSIHTSNFPALLQELGISLAVSTYQAGKLVLVRPDSDYLNTHFRSFNKPMGLAVSGDRLAIGTALEIWEYHNAPAVARRLRPGGLHDACFLPRSSVCTGDIQIHEMGLAAPSPLAPLGRGAGGEGEPELWFVNTRFSCLCTRSNQHSFQPRWRPPFVTALAPEDRCHLNGLALAPDEHGRLAPRFVTALGTSDTRSGWRTNKRNGGVVLEVPSGATISAGLAMPHSPRWHDGRLWVLESGSGGIGHVDLATGRYEEWARLPGFTRGLDFYGPLVFVGLSQVRESAVFSGIAIAEQPLAERCCGVWVLEAASGRTVAFLKFEDAVQEIFSVQVLPGIRSPELINDYPALLGDSFVVPEEALGAVPESLCYVAYSLNSAGVGLACRAGP
jgi:uncharacterized protein (TIGR03032 family)